MVQCLCGKWYNFTTLPDRCDCGQQLRITPEQKEQPRTPYDAEREGLRVPGAGRHNMIVAAQKQGYLRAVADYAPLVEAARLALAAAELAAFPSSENAAALDGLLWAAPKLRAALAALDSRGGAS